uniref:Uncharacterized protein n=1 Tax=Physcomitrium patens TaxID=3218 RepID=A0A2K1KNA2_PHYPA|nr:hypothetical protein PHYPA_006132 [Physcomitrium patens]
MRRTKQVNMVLGVSDSVLETASSILMKPSRESVMLDLQDELGHIGQQQPAWRGRNADRVREPYAGPDRVGVTARVRVMLKRKVFEEQSIFLLRV